MAGSSSADSSPARLAAHAGVRPSPGWLQSCRSHLIEQGETGGDNDAVLHQILNSDLRDVVRWAGDDNESTAEEAPLALRRAIRQSLPSTNDSPFKSALPEGFLLLVQVEECLDLSLNAECRASLGPASPNSPTPVGDQRKRCLKMFISDGYYDSGSPDPSQAHGSEETRHLLVAMETSPIPDISVHSQPGIKLLLRGPITVRFGILMLNEGNATVLGGVVRDLIPVQKKAREAARRLAGIGVDPTIKALIWNPNTGAEEEEDEGEEASSDVQAPVEAPTQRTITSNDARDAQPVVPLNFSSRRSAPNANRINEAARDSGPIITSSLAQNEFQCVSRNRNTGHQMQQRSQQRLPGVQSMNPKTNQPPIEDAKMADHISVASAVTSLSNTARSPSQIRTGNPYTNRNPYVSAAATTPQRTQQNPAHSGTSTRLQAASGMEKPSKVDVSANSMSGVSYSSPDQRITPQPPLETPREQTSIETVPSSSSARRDACPQNSQDSTISEPRSSRSSTAGATIGTSGLNFSPTALSEPMSFVELRELLTKAIAQPSLYGTYEDRTFIVPAKMKDIIHFTIARVKGKRKKGKDGKKVDKQYEFVMRCQFIGPEEDGIITCRIASSLLQPFFSVSPYELRKMHRENKEEGNKVVNEKGQEILSELNTLASIHLKLLMSRDEFFNQEKVPEDVDGDDAILLVCERDDL